MRLHPEDQGLIFRDSTRLALMAAAYSHIGSV
jgi:hypothetical protein